MLSLVLLRDRLRKAKDADGWTLGDICRAQCETSILRMATAGHCDSSTSVDPYAQRKANSASECVSLTPYPLTGSPGFVEGQETTWTDF